MMKFYKKITIHPIFCDTIDFSNNKPNKKPGPYSGGGYWLRATCTWGGVVRGGGLVFYFAKKHKKSCDTLSAIRAGGSGVAGGGVDRAPGDAGILGLHCVQRVLV